MLIGMIQQKTTFSQVNSDIEINLIYRKNYRSYEKSVGAVQNF